MRTDPDASAWNIQDGRFQQLTGKCYDFQKCLRKLLLTALVCGSEAVCPKCLWRSLCESHLCSQVWCNRLWRMVESAPLLFPELCGFLSLASSVLDHTGKGILGDIIVPSLSSHCRGGLGGRWLATDPASHTCCSSLMEHCSSHSYLSSLTVTYCNFPGQPNLKLVLPVKLSLNLKFSLIELTAICNMWLLVYCLVSISTVECKFPWGQVPNRLCLIPSTVFINKCMLITFLNFFF